MVESVERDNKLYFQLTKGNKKKGKKRPNKIRKKTRNMVSRILGYPPM